MTAKSQTSLVPGLLRSRQYSGTVSTLIYNWPIFVGISVFGLAAITAGILLQTPWTWLLMATGGLALLLLFNIIVASFVVYDWGKRREYDRLAELGYVDNANVVIDVTAGKLRGSRGLLPRMNRGHYFVIDIYDPQKMTDQALRRARELEPPLEANRRIYRRAAKPGSLPIPHKWADVVYCSFSLHELHDEVDREAIFAEFARILKPGGQLLLAEHGRGWLNVLAFGPGIVGVISPASWEKYMTKSGLTVKHHERWRGLVHLWVAEK